MTVITTEGLAWLRNQLAWEETLDRLRGQSGDLASAGAVARLAERRAVQTLVAEDRDKRAA